MPLTVREAVVTLLAREVEVLQPELLATLRVVGLGATRQRHERAAQRIVVQIEVLKVGEVAVTRLDLARNQITDDGAKALALMLVANSTLEYLNLESNMIGAKGGTAFVKAVPENTTLQYLNLQYNSLAGTSQQSLRDTWQRQRSGQLGLHV